MSKEDGKSVNSSFKMPEEFIPKESEFPALTSSPGRGTYASHARGGPYSDSFTRGGGRGKGSKPRGGGKSHNQRVASQPAQPPATTVVPTKAASVPKTPSPPASEHGGSGGEKATSSHPRSHELGSESEGEEQSGRDDESVASAASGREEGEFGEFNILVEKVKIAADTFGKYDGSVKTATDVTYHPQNFMNRGLFNFSAVADAWSESLKLSQTEIPKVTEQLKATDYWYKKALLVEEAIELGSRPVLAVTPRNVATKGEQGEGDFYDQF